MIHWWVLVHENLCFYNLIHEYYEVIYILIVIELIYKE